MAAMQANARAHTHANAGAHTSARANAPSTISEGALQRWFASVPAPASSSLRPPLVVAAAPTRAAAAPASANAQRIAPPPSTRTGPPPPPPRSSSSTASLLSNSNGGAGGAIAARNAAIAKASSAPGSMPMATRSPATRGRSTVLAPPSTMRRPLETTPPSSSSSQTEGGRSHASNAAPPPTGTSNGGATTMLGFVGISLSVSNSADFAAGNSNSAQESSSSTTTPTTHRRGKGIDVTPTLTIPRAAHPLAANAVIDSRYTVSKTGYGDDAFEPLREALTLRLKRDTYGGRGGGAAAAGARGGRGAWRGRGARGRGRGGATTTPDAEQPPPLTTNATSTTEVCEDGSTIVRYYSETVTTFTVPTPVGLCRWGVSPTATDLRTPGVPIRVGLEAFTGTTLTPVQQEICPKLLAFMRDGKHTPQMGIAKVPCGVGKTVIALWITLALGVKALMTAAKAQHLANMVDAVRRFAPTVRIGHIQGDRFEVDGYDIVCATTQTINARHYGSETFASFGLWIADEGHHNLAPTYLQARDGIRARCVLTLSATPRRKDGTTPSLMWHFGNLIVDVPRAHERVVCTIIRYERGDQTVLTYRNGEPREHAMVQRLIRDREYNEHVAAGIVHDIMHPWPMPDRRRKVLALSARLEHLEAMMGAVLARFVADQHAEDVATGRVDDGTVLMVERRLVLAGKRWTRARDAALERARRTFEKKENAAASKRCVIKKRRRKDTNDAAEDAATQPTMPTTTTPVDDQDRQRRLQRALDDALDEAVRVETCKVADARARRRARLTAAPEYDDSDNDDGFIVDDDREDVPYTGDSDEDDDDDIELDDVDETTRRTAAPARRARTKSAGKGRGSNNNKRRRTFGADAKAMRVTLGDYVFCVVRVDACSVADTPIVPAGEPRLGDDSPADVAGLLIDGASIVDPKRATATLASDRPVLLSVGYFVGGMKDERQEASKTADLLLGSADQAREGFDCAAIDEVVFMTSCGDGEQPCGRALRQSRKNFPRMVYWWLPFSVFESRGYRMNNLFKKEQWEIEHVTIAADGVGNDDDKTPQQRRHY